MLHLCFILSLLVPIGLLLSTVHRGAVPRPEDPQGDAAGGQTTRTRRHQRRLGSQHRCRCRPFDELAVRIVVERAPRGVGATRQAQLVRIGGFSCAVWCLSGLVFVQLSVDRDFLRIEHVYYYQLPVGVFLVIERVDAKRMHLIVL